MSIALIVLAIVAVVALTFAVIRHSTKPKTEQEHIDEWTDRQW